jgi:hypothetical protein
MAVALIAPTRQLRIDYARCTACSNSQSDDVWPWRHVGEDAAGRFQSQDLNRVGRPIHLAHALIRPPSPSSTDDLARRFSLPLPFADVVYSSPYDAFLGTSAEGGFAGRETIDGVECAALACEDDFVEVRIWIPTSGPPLPRRLRLVYKQMPGQPISELTFTSWSVGIDVDEETFACSPDPDFSRIAVEEFISGAGAS